MPELPEVATLTSQLNTLVSGSYITDCKASSHVRYASAVKAKNLFFGRFKRFGKFIVAQLHSSPSSVSGLAFSSKPSFSKPSLELVIHLGMTGQVLLKKYTGPASLDTVASDISHAHGIFLLDRESVSGGYSKNSLESSFLVFRDPRRFGRISCVTPGNYKAFPSLHKIGIDPLHSDFTPQFLFETLNSKHSKPAFIKTRLLNQTLISGVGNYLADEAFHRAFLHPHVRHLSLQDAELLHRALTDLVQDSTSQGGVSMRDYVHLDGSFGTFEKSLKVYGREGLPCLSCSTLLRKVQTDGRSSTFCPSCQAL